MVLSPVASYGNIPSFPYDRVIKFYNSKVCDNRKGHFIHRAPKHDSSNIVAAYLDEETGLLNIVFGADLLSTEVEIYKDGALVATSSLVVSTDDTIEYDLSQHGTGDYQIMVSNTEFDLYGSFLY